MRNRKYSRGYLPKLGAVSVILQGSDKGYRSGETLVRLRDQSLRWVSTGIVQIVEVVGADKVRGRAFTGYEGREGGIQGADIPDDTPPLSPKVRRAICKGCPLSKGSGTLRTCGNLLQETDLTCGCSIFIKSNVFFSHCPVGQW